MQKSIIVNRWCHSILQSRIIYSFEDNSWTYIANLKTTQEIIKHEKKTYNTKSKEKERWAIWCNIIRIGKLLIAYELSIGTWK